MFIASRAFAAVILIAASLAGYAASGAVIAHVAADHVLIPAHDDHDHGDSGEHRDHEADPGDEHSHDVTFTSDVPARTMGRSFDAQPLSVVLQSPAVLHDGPSIRRLTPPAHREHPPAPRRHTILLI